VSAPAMPAAQLACLLQDTAAGVSADDAAVTLIARHDHFLHQPGFRRIITAGSSIYSGEPVAVIRWRAAVHALDTGLLPCSSSEQAMLRIAASLGDPAIPVHLRSVLGGLDRRNITLVTAAITTASGS
jgi:hypothetical protein